MTYQDGRVVCVGDHINYAGHDGYVDSLVLKGTTKSEKLGLEEDAAYIRVPAIIGEWLLTHPAEDEELTLIQRGYNTSA